LRGVYLPISSVRQAVCALTETAILVLAFVGAVAIRFAGTHQLFIEYELLLPKGLLNAFLIQICFYYSDLYEEYTARRRVELYLRFVQAFLIGTLLLSLTYYVVPVMTVGRGILAIYLPLALGTLLVWRNAYFWIAGRGALSDSVLILGTGESAQRIAVEMLRRSPLGFRVVGFLGQHRAEVGRRLVNPSVIGTTSDLIPLVERDRVNLIVVALEDRRGKMPVADLLRCRLAGVRVEEVTNFYERLTGKILVKNLRPSWLVFSQGFNKPRLLRNSKRSAELMAALFILALASPLLALIALLIKLGSPGPVFYRQERVGEKGRVFPLFKFRTMRTDAEAATGPVWATHGLDPRITGVGRYLRKFRLDELPQFINVLRGEMSFVGPRPERPHFVDTLRKIIPYYDERHSVKPGITGWAQIKFGYGSTIEDAEEKLQFDLYYIKHMSLVFDLGILLDTLKVIVMGKGAR
jgi:sugar transferase (PEP-CTERM system associated)